MYVELHGQTMKYQEKDIMEVEVQLDGYAKREESE
jgi:hypothetical protein